MTLQEQYTYALEVISMAYDHLEKETPDVGLYDLRECVSELQKEVVNLNAVCDNVDSEKTKEIRTE